MDSSRAPTRRHALRLLGGTALAAVPSLRLPRETAAYRGWCRSDPIFMVNGKQGHVILSAEPDVPDLVTGPSIVLIRVPTGADVEFVWADSGFGDRGYDVQFEEHGSLKSTQNYDEIVVTVYVLTTALRKMLVQLQHAHMTTGQAFTDRKQGTTNDWVMVKGKL